MDRPRVYVDFNEKVDNDLVLLSRTDSKTDSAGNVVTFFEGMKVYVYSDDRDDVGRADNLLAEGVAEGNQRKDWTVSVKWCCRIDMRVGICHESEVCGSGNGA